MRVLKNFPVILAVLLAVSALGDPAGAQPGGMGPKRGFGGEGRGIPPFFIRAPREPQRRAGLLRTGLAPIYPAEARCEKVASFFGDRTRHDGSFRPERANNGYHNGIDLSLPEGTPLVAIANGLVIEKRERGRLAGIQIYFQHAPEDTGLPVWTYSKYQHLMKMPDLKVGERVKMGQVVGLSGLTGTAGGHYGPTGYPHLHLAMYMSPSEGHRFVRGQAFVARNGKFLDPLAFFYREKLDSQAISQLPEARKKFKIPYMTQDGKIFPAGARAVWPVMCRSGG